MLPLGRGRRDVTLTSFFDVLKGLHSVVLFNSKQGLFRELTINIPVEVIIIQSIFKSERNDISEDIHNGDLTSKQFVVVRYAYAKKVLFPCVLIIYCNKSPSNYQRA